MLQNKFNRNFKNLIVHHSKDMDGLFSYIISLDVLQNNDSLSLSFDYYDNENIIMEYVETYNVDNVIFIDVTASLDWYKQADKKGINVMIVDHHISKLKEIKQYVNPDLDYVLDDKTSEIDMAKITENLTIFYSNNSATKTLHLLCESSDLYNNVCGVEIYSESYLNEYSKQLIRMVDLYDVWKWEKLVINAQKIYNDKPYNLYELAKQLLKNKSILHKDIIEGVEAYMFNYSLNKTYKQTREIKGLLFNFFDDLTRNNIRTNYDTTLYLVDSDSEYSSRIMLNYIQEIITTNADDSINKTILDGCKEYIKDYESTQIFFETIGDGVDSNGDEMIQSVEFKGYYYLIVNYKFSNVIRDYFYNNYDDLDFIIFARFEGDKYKLTGRTLKQGVFNIGGLMKEKYNGGGHFDAGGGTAKYTLKDYNKFDNKTIINDYIEEQTNY